MTVQPRTVIEALEELINRIENIDRAQRELKRSIQMLEESHKTLRNAAVHGTLEASEPITTESERVEAHAAFETIWSMAGKERP